MATDWHAEASARSAETFAAAFPHFFLIGRGSSGATYKSGSTLTLDKDTLEQARNGPLGGRAMVLPVVKSLATFPSMVSIGRTNHNDIVVEDAQISKFHAFFRLRDQGLELEDAGSANGTTVDGVALVKGQPRALKGGERIGLGTLQLVLHDSAGAWSALRALRR